MQQTLMFRLLLLVGVAFSQCQAFALHTMILPPSKVQPKQCRKSRPWSLSSVSTTVVSDEILAKIRQGLDDAGGLEDWKAAIDKLCATMNIEAGEAELLLAKAHQWKAWASTRSDLMRKYITPTIPDVEKMERALLWLSSTDGPLEFTKEQLLHSIRQQPNLYLTTPEETYKQALKVAPAEYKDSSVFRKLILERPEAIQFTFNCEETGCQSECGSCWNTQVS